jgi:hypothetical protein
MIRFLRSLWILVRSTHRHPANKALHIFGLPLYVIGIAMVIGPYAGISTDQATGALIWPAAVTMFIIGHKIEGNLRSITPVLVCRLITSQVRRYLAANRVHVHTG